LTVPATVKHNGVTVETQQLRYRRAQETLQWDAAGNLTNDAVLAFTYDVLVDHSSTQQTVAGGDVKGSVLMIDKCEGSPALPTGPRRPKALPSHRFPATRSDQTHSARTAVHG
jgi:hypothetical protein